MRVCILETRERKRERDFVLGYIYEQIICCRKAVLQTCVKPTPAGQIDKTMAKLIGRMSQDTDE